jgi:hypothetical protein
MSKWENIRARINKNDGSFYQIDNYNLTVFEAIGFLLFIASFVIYILHDKTGFKETWLGWVFLIIGFVLIAIGIANRSENDKNT